MGRQRRSSEQGAFAYEDLPAAEARSLRSIPVAAPPFDFVDDQLTARNEKQLMRAYLGGKTSVALQELYELLRDSGFAGRDDGYRIIGDGQEEYKHRVRNFMSYEKSRERWHNVTNQPGIWLSNKGTGKPYESIFVSNGELCDVTLRVQSAVDMFRQQREQLDFVLGDPPWKRGVDKPGYANFARDESAVVSGYVEIGNDEDMTDITTEWLAAAIEAMRDGAQVSIITGPDQAAYVKIAGDRLGLTMVDKLIAPRTFPTRTTTRFSPSYWEITTFCKGPLDHPRRIFKDLPELARARSGAPYPQSVLPQIDKYERFNVRYANALPPQLLGMTFRARTEPGNLVGLPFCGSGNPVTVGIQLGLRLVSCDLNKGSIVLTETRMADIATRAALDTELLKVPAIIPPDRRIVRDHQMTIGF